MARLRLFEQSAAEQAGQADKASSEQTQSAWFRNSGHREIAAGDSSGTQDNENGPSYHRTSARLSGDGYHSSDVGECAVEAAHEQGRRTTDNV